jgi:hypothetical protein
MTSFRFLGHGAGLDRLVGFLAGTVEKNKRETRAVSDNVMEGN